MDGVPSHELPPIENDLEGTAIFQKMRVTEAVPNALAEKRQMQVAFDDVLSKLGTRAVAPKEGESHEHYLATLGTQAAAYGPEERRKIDRLSLPPAALAEIARQDLAHAKAEIEKPNHSLRPGEVREVIKTDRAGHQISEFHTKRGPSFWMNDFADPVVRYVSGGSKGIATEDRSGTYKFDNSDLPELREAARQMEYRESAEFKVQRAYAEAGLAAPAEVLAKIRGV